MLSREARGVNFPSSQADNFSSGHLICTGQGCGALLTYLQGAAYVQCALCHTVIPAPSSEDIAWLTCGSCHIQLMYRSGAASVSCTVCNSITAAPVAPISDNQVRYCQCGGCRMMLKYSAGALSVQCAACQYITVTIFTRGKRGANMVVVENPPTLDENGHVKNSTSVGLAEDS